MDPLPTKHSPTPRTVVHDPPKPSPDPALVSAAAALLKSAHSPLVVLGKGAAYSRAEQSIRSLVNNSHLPFLPTPMGKGIMPNSSPLNTSSARSTALREADVILVLGARLNWILHFGAPPKFRRDVKIIHVDISPEELGRTNGLGEPALSIFADITLTVDALAKELKDWKALPQPTFENSPPDSYPAKLAASIAENEEESQTLALTETPPNTPMTFHRAFHVIKETLHAITPPSAGEIVYVSEGSRTMDISRSIFPLDHPRQKLDAGTYATMGVGMAYAIAAWAAYNLPQSQIASSSNGGPKKRKKIVAIEGDSALGFSGMEIETMARFGMDVLILCMNNSGIYHGDTTDRGEWKKLQTQTIHGDTVRGSTEKREKKGLRSTSLYYETRYEKLADMVGGRGYFVRSEEELARAVDQGFRERERVVLINVIVEPGVGKSISQGWQMAKEKHGDDGSGGSKAEGRESKL